MTISNNTIVGANEGMTHYTGWNLRLLNNVMVDVGNTHKMLRNSYNWYPDSWPGVIGDWAYADLTPTHPYYPYMPRFLRDMVGEYHKVVASGNVYPMVPALSMGVESEYYNLGGTTFSDDYEVIDASVLKAHMRNANADDYRRDPNNLGPLQNVGSKMR
jgi:hypothetical protein